MPLSLPVELYRPIVDGVARQDLICLCSVSRVLQAEAESRIYYRVVLAKSVDIIVGCRKLLAVPRFQRLVRVLHIITPERQPGPLRLSNFQRLLASVLRKVVNLIALRVEPTVLERCGDTFRGCSFRLQQLYCSFAPDEELNSFLKLQSSIRAFDWQPQRPWHIDFLSPDVLPNLTILALTGYFVGNPSTLQLIARQPINHLLWVPYLTLPTYLPTVPLRSLRYFGRFGDDMLLSLPTKYPLLEYLAFVYDDNVCDPPCKSAFRLLTLFFSQEPLLLSSVLPHLKHLQILIFHEPRTQDDTRGRLNNLFTTCPTLERVRFGMYGAFWERRNLKNWIQLVRDQDYIPDRNLWFETLQA
jgi:hypothetical protein